MSLNKDDLYKAVAHGTLEECYEALSNFNNFTFDDDEMNELENLFLPHLVIRTKTYLSTLQDSQLKFAKNTKKKFLIFRKATFNASNSKIKEFVNQLDEIWEIIDNGEYFQWHLYNFNSFDENRKEYFTFDNTVNKKLIMNITKQNAKDENSGPLKLVQYKYELEYFWHYIYPGSIISDANTLISLAELFHNERNDFQLEFKKQNNFFILQQKKMCSEKTFYKIDFESEYDVLENFCYRVCAHRLEENYNVFVYYETPIDAFEKNKEMNDNLKPVMLSYQTTIGKKGDQCSIINKEFRNGVKSILAGIDFVGVYNSETQQHEKHNVQQFLDPSMNKTMERLDECLNKLIEEYNVSENSDHIFDVSIKNGDVNLTPIIQKAVKVCEFTRNGVTKIINVESATPANLAKLFKVHPQSMVLVSYSDLIVVNGNQFDPPLEDGMTYEVKDTDYSIIPSRVVAMNNQLKTRTPFSIISSEDQLSDIVHSVIETTKAINYNVCMLYDGPNAVSVVNSLAVLAAVADDLSLINKIMPCKMFKRLPTPGSFSSSLYQILTSMCTAFRTADISMVTIQLRLIGMPDHIQNTLYSVVTKNVKERLEYITHITAKASKKCKKAAEDARNSFREVLKDLQELIQGALSAKSASSISLKNSANELEEFKIRQEQQKNEIRKQEHEYQERMKLVNEAAIAYKEVFKPVDVEKLIGISLTDMSKGFIKNTVSSFSPAFETKTEDNDSERQDRETERKDKNVEAMKQSKHDIADLITKMNNLDLTKIELVIKCLEDCCQFLRNVEQHWTKLAQFFNSINLIVENNLSKSIENFSEQSKECDPANALVKPALIAAGLCVQLCNCASVYNEISQQYVMPVISRFPEIFALSKEEAYTKTTQLRNDHDAMIEKVRQLIDRKMDEYSNKFEDKLKTNQ